MLAHHVRSTEKVAIGRIGASPCCLFATLALRHAAVCEIAIGASRRDGLGFEKFTSTRLAGTRTESSAGVKTKAVTQADNGSSTRSGGFVSTVDSFSA